MSVSSTATNSSYESQAKRAKTVEDEKNEESEIEEENDVENEEKNDVSSDSSSAASDDDDDLVVTQSAKDTTVNIWEVVRESADEDFDGNALNAYVALFSSWRWFKKDVYHQTVM